MKFGTRKAPFLRWLAMSALMAAPLCLGVSNARADEDGIKEKKVDLTTVVHGAVSEEQVTAIDDAIIAEIEKAGWTVVDDKDDDHEVDLTITVEMDDADDDDDGVADADDTDDADDGDGKGIHILASWDDDDEEDAEADVEDDADDDTAAQTIIVVFLKDAEDGDLDDDDD